VGKKKKKKAQEQEAPEPGFTLTYKRLAIIGGTVLSLLGTASTLLYKSITKQLDELKDGIEKIDSENDEEREKDRGRFEETDKRFDQNDKDADERFDKIEDRMTRMEMAMQAQKEAASAAVTKRRKGSKRWTPMSELTFPWLDGLDNYELTARQRAKYDRLYRRLRSQGLSAKQATRRVHQRVRQEVLRKSRESYPEKAMEEARSVGVARVLEGWGGTQDFRSYAKGQCEQFKAAPWICRVCEEGSERLCASAFASPEGPAKPYSEPWFYYKDTVGEMSPRDERQLRRARRKAKRRCQKGVSLCVTVSLPRNLWKASDTLSDLQNYEANLSQSLRNPAR
jgi:hypothetical protein